MKRKSRQILIGYLIASIIVWLGCGCYYGYRFIHYYKLEEKGQLPSTEVTYNNLNEFILSGVVSEGNGLIKDSDGSYYYYGKVANNYLYYSGLTWRIMGIDENGFIKLISQDNLYANVYSVDENNNYYDSRVYTYLSKDSSGSQNVNKLLDEPAKYLYYNNYCQGKITDENDTTCTLTTGYEYVGTLSVADYVKAGGANSYLNTGSAVWTSNSLSGSNDTVFYITSNGTVSTFKLKEEDKPVYSIRATILLKPYLEIVSGNGSVSNPFTINSNDYVSELSNANLGTYVNYSNKLWRVIDINSSCIKLLSNDVIKNSSVADIASLENSDGVFESVYGTVIYNGSSGIAQYVNKYLEELDDSYLVSATFNNSKYNLSSNFSLNDYTYTSKIGAPTPKDFLATSTTTSKVAYWTGNYYSSDVEFINYISAGGAVSQDYRGKEHAFRPVVAINKNVVVTGGNGSYNNPYTISLGA